MSVDIGSLIVRFEANAQGLVNAIDQTENKINKFGSGMKKLGGIIAGAFAFGAVVNSIKDVTNAAMESERAENRLQTLMNNVPGTTQAQIDALKKLAAAQQRLGVVEDDATIAGQSQLATFQLSASSIGKLTPAFQDLAVGIYGANVSQEQMIQTGNLIGKVMQGNVGALSKAGVSFTAAQEEILKTGTEAEKTAALVEVLGANFGGLNKATRNTTEGGIIAFNNALGDIKETIGAKLLPKINEFAIWLTDHLPQIQDFVTNALDKMRDAFQFIKEKADILIPVLGGVFGAIVLLKVVETVNTLMTIWSKTVKILTTEQWALNIAMNANVIGLVILGIAALIAAGVLLWKNWDWVKEKALALWQTLKDNPLYALVAGPIGALIAAGITIANNWDMIKSKAMQVFGTLRDFVGGVAASISGSFRGMVNGVISAFNFMIRALNRLRFTVPDWVPKIGGQGFGFNLRELPSFASGVQNFRGGMALVGERGPELINLPRGSDVIPADRTRQALGQTITNTFVIENMNVRSDNDVKMIARELFNLQKSRARGSGAVAT